MDEPIASRHYRALLAILAAAALACGGDDPSGPPRDRTPPPAPELGLISVGVPSGGEATVRGEVGSVEATSTVVLENLTAGARGGSPVVVESRSSVEGAFAVSMPAVLGDELSILARDDAGNHGPAVRLLAGPNPATFRLSEISGSNQVGVVSRPLTDLLRVSVRGGVSLFSVPDVEVRFEVVSGGGTLNPATALTDSGGVAEATLTLGPAPGAVQVRASVAGLDQALLFNVTAVGPPQIAAITPAEGERGSTVTIAGRNFSPIAAHNITEFDGVQAEVVSADGDRLSAIVPTFASDGAVTVTLTGVRSNGLPFKVKGPPPVLPAVGSVQLTHVPTALGEVRLGFLTGNEEYVVAVEALSQNAAATFRHSVAGDAAVPSQGEEVRAAAQVVQDAQARMESVLRVWEADVARSAKGRPRPSGLRLMQEPQIGDRREFHVINTLNPAASLTDPANFDSVGAILRYKGAHTLVFVDERVPAADLTDDDVRLVGDRFETQTYGINRTAFGTESDINTDSRVTILLTATVNELNQGASPDEGFVIGFFFGLDLLPQFSPGTSNAQEIFYGFVPDPGGQFGPPVARELVIPVLNEVFAHEFQHMISFNEHVLVRGGQSEELWLNEGLSHIAEDLNGFDSGNLIRSALYLNDPGATGLALAGNSLAERGASFLFLRHLGDQRGPDTFRSLVQTTATGTINVELAASQSFGNLFSDWFAALFLDDTGFGSDPRFQIPSLSLRASYDEVRAGEPTLGLGPYLRVQFLQLPGADLSTTTVGTAGAFYAVTTTAGRNERKLRVSAPFSSNTQVAVIRTR